MENLEETTEKQHISIGKVLDLIFVPTSGIRWLRRFERENGVVNEPIADMHRLTIYLAEIGRLGLYATMILANYRGL
jgi:hypothetical protein